MVKAVQQAHRSSLTLERLQRALSGQDILLVGNSISRNVYFTLKALLELATNPNHTSTAVVSASVQLDVSSMYRNREKALCPPRRASAACNCTVGSTNLAAYWSVIGLLPPDVLQSAVVAADRRGAQLKVIVFNSIWHPLALPPEVSLRDVACARAFELQSLLSIHKSIFWLPAGRACDVPSPGALAFHNVSVLYSLATLNHRVERHNQQLACTLTSAGDADNASVTVLENNLSPRASRGLGPVSDDPACQCYDDWIHHCRLSFLTVIRIAQAVWAHPGGGSNRAHDAQDCGGAAAVCGRSSGGYEAQPERLAAVLARHQ
eukprot:3250600-Prymnesium_polylepis.1